MTTTSLWKLNFVRMCTSNLLLFISLYMLLPVLPVVMANRLSVSVDQTGSAFLLFVLGMFVVGPFHGYLVDVYKRKNICLYAFCAMVIVTMGYLFVESLTYFLLLCLLHGIAFGVATTAGITLAIDITDSALRSNSNVAFSWMARMGMIVGIALGGWVYALYGFTLLLYVSVGIGVAGVLCVSQVYVLFRAPIGVAVCSIDRFWLPRGWIPALNLALIAFVPGTLLPIFHESLNGVTVGHVYIPFFAITGVGFLLSVLLAGLLFKKADKMVFQVLAGLSIMAIGMAMLYCPNVEAIFVVALLLGIGLGLVAPEFLLMFVKFSKHCQRGTANTTHLLSWEVGISLGIAVVCYRNADASQAVVGQAGLIASIGAILFFVLVTYPYYKRMKVR